MTKAEKAKIEALEAELAELKAEVHARRSPAPPVPYKPEKPPQWAQQDDNCGINYSGPPSVPQRIDPGSSVVGIKVDPATGYRKFPDGLVRDDLGQVVPHSITGPAPTRAVGPAYSYRHTADVALIDQILGEDR
jgi:hypothetical protein